MAIQVNIAEAKAKLSALIEAAEKGEDVIIARNGEPVARVSALSPKRQIEFGALKKYGWVAKTPYEALAPEPEHAVDSPVMPGAAER
jgi:prevent-host-death family protein